MLYVWYVHGDEYTLNWEVFVMPIYFLDIITSY